LEDIRIMSVSILIPTYNYDCTELARDIQEQAELAGMDYEIIIGDDGSTDGRIVSRLVDFCSHPHCKLLRQKRNVGRAAIRNILGHEASGDNLLFMDSDAEMAVSNFLSSYINAIEDHEVVSGFIAHPSTPPAADMLLRYEYEKHAEKRFSAHHLNRIAHPPFSTFCFMIRKTLFSRFSFDESYTGYGYEDVQYGKVLRDHGYRVFYINVPLRHNGMEKNYRFIEKTETALHALREHKAELMDEVHLLRTIHKLRRVGMEGLVRRMLGKLLPRMRRNLCSDHARLRWFSWYKLGYYLNHCQ